MLEDRNEMFALLESMIYKTDKMIETGLTNKELNEIAQDMMFDKKLHETIKSTDSVNIIAAKYLAYMMHVIIDHFKMNRGIIH